MQSACASIPLIDGMVIPLHLLSFFLRQAVHNLSRRKRLEDSQRFVEVFLSKEKHISFRVVLKRLILYEKLE
jgi:hypothetical protein